MLKEVMVLSVGDSTYSLSTLSSDPHTKPDTLLSNDGPVTERTCIVRTFGNVGKYGISLLIPPPELKMRKPKSGEWNVINHDIWDGASADSFGETSLHLFLTEYRVAYTSSHRGNRDIQAFFQEAAISIYDGKTWVGDVDVVRAMKHDSAMLLRISKRKEQLKREALANEIACVDNWYELLDKPDRPVLVRSRGKWLGRLAAASISLQLGHRVVLLPNDGCPKGCFTDVKFMRDYLVRTGDVIIDVIN
ncbi:uncharacterized protein TRIVIDRAFT_151499 [Trichoderma virens Gv29-8]|uniref:Uncharacterized protein n=1 Tax=Hypocrea virens (strain Gv29-8 / FGSC 10586) TaxID=413071 RepID=G9MUD6_HYPVG|nr:uncharacterized protein TRIVIDRAFT_151499 [Trichoderma virens Gv29-8]EHK21949.1 hypothetical protein TRIVIDRAFT_151499 [Trichoderma virens Gv29-8]